MNRTGAHHVIRTSLHLGIQFDDYDYRQFLRGYHEELSARFPDEALGTFSPSEVLDTLIPRFDPDGASGHAGARYTALKHYALKSLKLDLSMTASDFGPFEQRKSPYCFDRAFYHVGRTVCACRVRMDFPGYNPYRATRQWNPDFVRDNFDGVLELLPDYLWWSMHDQKDAIVAALEPTAMAEVRRRVDQAGFNTEKFGLYLTTLESLHMEGEDIPE